MDKDELTQKTDSTARRERPVEHGVSINLEYALCHVIINGCPGIFTKIIDGNICCNECEQTLNDVWNIFGKAIKTLEEIYSFRDKTLLGDPEGKEPQHQLGANKAFKECADLAKIVIDQC